MQSTRFLLISLFLLIPISSQASEESTTSIEGLQVKITRNLDKVDIQHNGKALTIMRNQDTKNTINPGFAKTSRKCPPFCVQPMIPAPGVETIDELQLLDYQNRVIT